MKKIIAYCLAILCFSGFSVYGEEIETSAKAVILMEGETGKILYEANADEALPPASVTKVMTLLLVMEAIDSGKIALDDPVSVSERAAEMGGSQIFLEVGEEMTVEELVKSVVIASANDAAAALAEYVAGSLEVFVADMNDRAATLGMTNTHFENTNGLDDTTTEHLISAKDIAIMSRELLKHETILKYTTIWMDSVRNGAFGLTNTNKLLRFYKGVNGLKTGFTSKAGYCISATAKRDGMQLIAVVMGSPTAQERNATAAKLLDYGFANYKMFTPTPDYPTVLPLSAGQKKECALVCAPSSYLLKKGQDQKVEIIVELPDKLVAPIEKGAQVGQISYTLDGEVLGSDRIYAAETVKRLTFADIFKELFAAYTSF